MSRSMSAMLMVATCWGAGFVELLELDELELELELDELDDEDRCR